MSKVWERDMPPAEKLLLLCLADFADDHGKNICPSVGLMCAKTGITDRTCRRMIAAFRTQGILIMLRKMPKTHTIEYKLVMPGISQECENGPRIDDQARPPTQCPPAPSLEAPAPSPAQPACKETWMSPYDLLFLEQYGGHIPFKAWASEFKKMESAYTGAVVLAAWANYVKATPGQFNPNVFKFSRTINTWLPKVSVAKGAEKLYANDPSNEWR